MCSASSGSKRKPLTFGETMEGEVEKQEGFRCKFSVLLELASSNDLIGFKRAVEHEGYDVDEASFWYGRRLGSKKMGFEERTPMMIAAMYGSTDVLNYIVERGCVDVNRVCGTDRVTALHCAVAGGSAATVEIVKLLLAASADINSVDANGNLPADLFVPVLKYVFKSRKQALMVLLNGSSSIEEISNLSQQVVNEVEERENQEVLAPRVSKDGTEKKGYPVDLSLPDIKNGIYSTDEFRIYVYKVKPCSRAYSHDWTECPFVHPGENARRRDPRKYHYSCVPCQEFKKGSCRQGDACEYAHGIFECWLHPALYRTRLCKDETGCNRRVCFFAHKTEELRPLYASTGSAVPSPRSYSASASSLDMGSMSPFTLGSPSMLMPPCSTPPLTPTGASSPMCGSMWPNQPNIAPPTLHLPGSRLKSALNARDMDLYGPESCQRQHKLMNEMSSLSSPSSWNNGFSSSSGFAASGDQIGELNRMGGVKPTNLEDVFGSMDSAILPQFQGMSLDSTTTQFHSPSGIQMRQGVNSQLHSSYPTSFSSSPGRATSFGVDASGAAVAAFNSRSVAFAKRSQSFIERNSVNRHSGLSSPIGSPRRNLSNFSDWGSPDGNLDWGINGDELNKLRKSASFGFRTNGSNSSSNYAVPAMPATIMDEPDVSWVQSLVKDTPPSRPGQINFEDQQQCHLDTGSPEALPAWVEQLYMEQEQMVA